MSVEPADLGARLRRELITPEGVDLRLQLGDAGQRATAFLIDAAIIVGVLVVLTLGVIFAFAALGAGGAKKGGEYLAVIWLLGFFLLRNGYFIAFELRPGAATPGKRVLGLRVAARNGGRLTADAIFARNAMRELEVFLPISMLFAGNGGDAVESWMYLLGVVWAGIFALFPLFNKDRLRVGDMIAGTWVVRAPRQKLMADLSEEGAGAGSRFTFDRKQLEAYGVKELHVLEEVLRRNDRKTLRAVAERIQRKIGWTPNPDIGDRDFLTAYYAGLRQRLEQRLLFGHRRKDKFDTA